MANAEEEYLRLIFEVKGQAEYDRLQKELAQTGAHILELKRAFDSGAISEAEYAAATARAADQQARLERQVIAAAAAMAAGTAATTKAAAAAKSLGNPGIAQGVQAASYAFQDFTSTSGSLAQKLNSVSNNVPGLLMLFGPGGPWTIAIGTAITAGIALYQNWNSVLKLFGAGQEIPKAAKDLDGLKHELEKVKTELEELEKLGYLSTSQGDRYKDLQRQEKDLKNQVKAAELIKRVTDKKSDAEEAVAKAFEEAMATGNAKDTVKMLENAVPDLRVFREALVKISEGDRAAYEELAKFSQTLGGEGQAFARQMQFRLQEALSKLEQPMDAAVKQWKATVGKRLEEMKQLEQQGLEIQQDMIHDLEKEAEDGLKHVLTKPLEDFLVKSRAAGVDIKKETAHLRNEIEQEAMRLYPELARSFPQAFRHVVDGLRVAMTESIDRTIEELAQAERLTKQEAARRLERERQRKQEGQEGEKAQDEMEQFVGQAHAAMRRVNPGLPQLTPEMRKQIAEQMRDQLRGAGMTPQQQAEFGKFVNNPRFRTVVPQAIANMGAKGMSMPQALQQLPNVMRQMVNGAGGVDQAVDRVINQLINNQAALLNRNAKLTAGQRAQLRAAQQIGQMLQPQQDPGLNFGGFP